MARSRSRATTARSWPRGCPIWASGSSWPGGKRTRRAVLALFLALALLTACSNNGKAPLRQLPVQLGRAPPPTPTPRPTATAVPPPPCSTPSTTVSNVSQQRGPGEALTVSGQLKSNCSVVVDVTLFAKWLDGPDAAEDARAFTTVRRVQPGEVRQFSEVVPAARGASKLDLSADVALSGVARRR